jgi:hypothetical protein
VIPEIKIWRSANLMVSRYGEAAKLESAKRAEDEHLKGVPNGTAATIASELPIAQPRGATPVVVLMHGPGGIDPNVGIWVGDFNEMGISTLVIDDHYSRDVRSHSYGKPCADLSNKPPAVPAGHDRKWSSASW